MWWFIFKLTIVQTLGQKNVLMAIYMLILVSMGRMSTLAHFTLAQESGCEDYTFLDQAVENFEQVWIQFKCITLIKHLICLLHVKSQVLLPLQHIQGFFPKLVPVKIVLRWNWHLILNHASCDTRLWLAFGCATACKMFTSKHVCFFKGIQQFLDSIIWTT